MNWILWAMAGLLALGAIFTITSVGKPREPLTPGVVAASTVISALYIWAIVAVGIYG